MYIDKIGEQQAEYIHSGDFYIVHNNEHFIKSQNSDCGGPVTLTIIIAAVREGDDTNKEDIYNLKYD